MMDGRHLARALADPTYAARLDERGWTALLAIAQAERLAGSLAVRLDGIAMPETAREVLANALASAESGRVHALWEAEMAHRALSPLGIPVTLLKGTAYVAAGLDAGRGRMIGDLDILVSRDRLNAAEAALLSAGWEWVKSDAYDDAYYRRWMHELPPLIHAVRDRMIDVHHTILPLTARHGHVDDGALLAGAVELGDGRYTLSPEDLLIHAVAHLLADGDLAGGLRNLWDIDRLIREHAVTDGYWTRLAQRARLHDLVPQVSRALRLTHHLFDTPVDDYLAYQPRRGDIAFTSRLLARDGWGRETRQALRFAFTARSHWIRMPAPLLARHLFTKWRKSKRAP